MKPEQENKVVRLAPHSVRPPATRLSAHTSPHKTGGGLSVSARQEAWAPPHVRERVRVGNVASSQNLTDSRFSVTRARACAHAHASAHAHAYARRDSGALGRVIDAALIGGDVRIAAVKPSGFLAKVVAFLLLPMTLLAPLAPAYADEAPLADRVASDVAAVVGNTASPAVADATPASPAASAAPAGATDTSANPTTQDATPATASAENTAAVAAAGDTAAPSATSASGGSSGTPASNSAPAGNATNAAPATPPANTTVESGSGGGGGDGATVPVAPSAIAATTTTTATDTASVAASTTIVHVPPQDTPAKVFTTATDTPEALVASSTASTTNGLSLDALPPAEAESLEQLRTRIRAELHDEVRSEVRKEVEDEVYQGCKNLDGIGYYCIPDAKSFGAPVVSNERKITAVVQLDSTYGNKQIFLVRDSTTIQLTHAVDDNIFPSLDPVGNTLVWQSLTKGHWQIAYAHVDEPGVPVVHYLTAGENNFNPKVFGGRIVWQAWLDGNWEIVTATPAHEHIPDDALSAEHRALGVDGDFDVARITNNRAPDMFPSLDGSTITWQAMDGGVWQVFAYDIASGVSRRVSKPGVKSDRPMSALVWNETDDSGQTHVFANEAGVGDAYDITLVARRLVDNARHTPKTPITETQVVVSTPLVVKDENDASSTATSTPTVH